MNNKKQADTYSNTWSKKPASRYTEVGVERTLSQPRFFFFFFFANRCLVSYQIFSSGPSLVPGCALWCEIYAR